METYTRNEHASFYITNRARVYSSPVTWVKGDGSWMLHLSSEERCAHGAVKLGHLDLVQIALHPVDVSGNPVHSQTLWSGQTILDHHLKTGQGCTEAKRMTWHHQKKHECATKHFGFIISHTLLHLSNKKGIKRFGTLQSCSIFIPLKNDTLCFSIHLLLRLMLWNICKTC